MTTLLELKEKLTRFYGKYDIYITPVIKFTVALTAFLLINHNIGYMEKISSTPIALILALICSILPVGGAVFIGSVLILLDMYALSVEVCIVALILFSPIMLLTAILIKLTSPGPLIYCQERVGLHNRPFKMYKFRSMGVQSASKEQKAWTVHNDPRVTPVGKIIRKTSLDELPQLFNVLKGDMSLIGPRPERPLFVEKFKEEIPRYMIKHQVRPGMTGWAQVCGFRGDTSIEGRIEHDIFYIENWTLSFDIKILFLTVFKGFVNKNAY